jgi:hypothetical protein
MNEDGGKGNEGSRISDASGLREQRNVKMGQNKQKMLGGRRARK